VAALTVNSLTSSAFEAANTASTEIDLVDNEFFTASIARQAVMSLRGQNAKPKADGMFYGKTKSTCARRRKRMMP